MRDLLQVSDPAELKAAVDAYAGYATSIFLIGWASGGLLFGVLGDRIGRAKTMLMTILLYSLFAGLSAFSVTFWDFALYRFLTGLGVGGEFAVGVALVAEVMPERARPYALSLLQALSAIGNVTAALLNMTMGSLVERGLVDSVWRPLFIVGAVPARYNVGRFVAAIGPALLALLTTHVFANTDEPLRYAGLTMCSIFLVGLLVLPLAPETKGRPLPQ